MTNQEVAKASQEEATALSNMRQAYKDFTEDMNQRYEALRTEFDEFKKEFTNNEHSIKNKVIKSLIIFNYFSLVYIAIVFCESLNPVL